MTSNRVSEGGYFVYHHRTRSLTLIAGIKSSAAWIMITWIHGDRRAEADRDCLYWLWRSKPASRGNQAVKLINKIIQPI